ncbi:enoyl-CoA hydratase/isomerase family protein [Pararobbsia alpina]|uniref:3-hydroxyisobutyryl-CoA hydrolase n=1 Tax=Pararobbsia alpina TaxID=621374 RepID=A0A6S7B0B4_9BURK|nr:enoyl-CoA hydratase/isomerase family protein [Pararobbsia alpina]CAB3783599.1 1,4-dihydroxy-2-naphthoyl-CoA synthase [Pararobbsia alpina]
MADTAETILFHVSHRLAIITLNRESALNALNRDMVRELAACLDTCRNDEQIDALVLRGAGAKGFCAGGDVRALYHQAKDSEVDWPQFFIDEYRLDFALHTFAKPVVALMDGVTMGGGMGLAQGVPLRIATERSKIAMPEARIGLVPDVGATYFLNTMPIELALYVGLTGVTLSGADAVACNLADACVPGEWLRDFESRLDTLEDASSLDPLARIFVPPSDVRPPAPIEALLPLIRRHFAAQASLEDMVASLESDASQPIPSEQRAWVEATLTALKAGSPLALNVTREALIRGRQMTLGACFQMEFDLVTRSIRDGDFLEGVRARLVDKDGMPRWVPPTLDAVDAGRVQDFFDSAWHGGAHPLSDLGDGPGRRYG